MKEFLEKHLISIMNSILSAFCPLFPILGTVAFLLFCDLFTGIWRAMKEKKTINFYKGIDTILKTLAYFIIIICTFLFETYIFTGIPITKIIAGFITSVELKSVFENATAITGMNFWDKVKNLFKDPLP